MDLQTAVATVHNNLIGAVEDSLGSDSSEAEQLDAAWAVIQDKVGPLVSPSKSTPQNEYSSGSHNPGSSKSVKVINAAYSFAFEVYTPIPEGVDEDEFESDMDQGIIRVDGHYLRKALLDRLNRLSDRELMEACDGSWDSCIDDVDAFKVNGGLAVEEEVQRDQ